jgi:quinol-cytochrome oxidoreductase complex cytochrome b subunit
MVVWLVLVGFLVTLSIFFPPSLDEAADLMAPAPEGIKPEWYFLFLFQTLKIFPSTILFVSGDTLAVLIILFFAILFFFLPLIDNKPEKMKGRIISFIAVVFLVFAVGMSVWSLLE